MISKSPGRHQFQIDNYINKCKGKNESPSEEYLELFIKMKNNHQLRFEDENSRQNNLEYDLLTTEWILLKARESKSYSQNIYAALCNNEFQKLDVMPILLDKYWACSWRYAGGIVADMRQEGDYIDWYCSGIRDVEHPSALEWNSWTNEQQNHWQNISSKYVPEGLITEEIKVDLKKLGWIPAPGGDWEKFDE